MALLAWLPLFLLQLFSAILGKDLHYLPAFSKIEVLRWQQPICTSASPCQTYEYRHSNVEEVQQKVLNVREVRDSIDIDELEPSTLDSSVIYEKLYAPEHSDDARSKRHFNGRYLPNDPPPAILVTKVIDSPVMATIVGRSCIDGVPSCANGPTRVPIQLPPKEEYVLQRTLEALENKKQSLYDVLSHKKESVVQTFDKAVAGEKEFVEGFVEKKNHVVQEIIDEVSHKKDAIVGAVESVKQSIVDNLSHKKDAIVGAVSSAAAAKHEFVQGIIDKKMETVQPIVDAINEKKDKIVGVVAGVAATKYGYVKAVVNNVHEKEKQVVEAVSGAATAKHEFVEGIVQKKVEKVQAVKDTIIGGVVNATKAKHEFVEGIVEKKKEKVQAIKDEIVGTVVNATKAKHEFVEGIVEKKKEKLQAVKDEIVGTVVNATKAKHEFVEGIVEKKHEKLQEKKDKIVDAVSSAVTSKKEFVEGIVEKKHEKIQEKKDKVVAALFNAAASKQEFVEGIVEKKKDKVQAVVDEVTEKKDKVVKVVSNATAATHEYIEGIVEKKHEKLQQKKDEIVQAASSIVQGAIEKKQEKIQGIKDHFSTLSAEKQAAVQKVIDKTIQAVHDFEEAKEKAEQELAQKKQAFVQSVADKKIEAIKHVSEKTQEFIGTASLVKPLIASQIKQAFGKNEEEIARKTDEGNDFVFLDEDEVPTMVDEGNDVQDEETQGRSISLLKKIILKKFKPSGPNNETNEAATPVGTPASPVVPTQPPASSIPDTDNSTEGEEIISVTEKPEIPTTGPTGIEVPEEVVTSSTIPEETSNEVPELPATTPPPATTYSSTPSHKDVGIQVDAPTTVPNKIVYVPVEVNPDTPTVLQPVPVVQPCAQPNTVAEVPANNKTFTFGAEIKWIKQNNIEPANVAEDVVAKNANVESENLQAPDVEGKSALIDVDEIVPKDVDVDVFIAGLLSKLVSDEDVAASEAVFAKNADVDTKVANEEVVVKNVAVETESSLDNVEKAKASVRKLMNESN